MDKINLGFIGLGNRGIYLLKDVCLAQGETVAAVCDVYPDRAQKGAEAVKEVTGTEPAVYSDYRDVLRDESVTVIVIATAWEYHIEIAVEAMKAGKAVAMEVGGAYTTDDCYTLVKTWEQTRVPFMFLENCCFGRREMMALHMAQQGLFGEIVHMAGGYHHDLRKEIAYGVEDRHYRLRNYLTRNCENYPTHELGPIAKILKINHGNRMLTLTSTASKAAGMHDYIVRNKPQDQYLQQKAFAQGDVVSTVIRCAGGQTITLTLDTTLPRFYSRGFSVRGTRGMYDETTDSVFFDREEDAAHDLDWRKCCVGNAEQYQREHDHPVWKKYLAQGVKGGHDGMDWLEFQQFFEALRNNKPMPIDVYDAASWMVITALSEQSIAKGSVPVEIPDFTNGRWHMDPSVVKEQI